MGKLITILTPTYNRAILLQRLYMSLKMQLSCNFIWLIIDDGSTDNTDEVVAGFNNDRFEIEYVKQINGGKHRALNNGICRVKSPFTFIVDSDDTLTKDAILTIEKAAESIDGRDICALCFLRGQNFESVIGTSYPQSKVIRPFMNFAWNRHVKGDKAEIWVTDLLKKEPFPEIEGENFFSEGYIWTRIGRNRNAYFENKIIYITEYLEDGLTHKAREIRVQAPVGSSINANELTTKEFHLALRFKNSILYVCYCLLSRYKISTIIKQSKNKTFLLFSWPFGIILYKIWKKQYNL